MCGKQQQAGRAPGWWLTAPRARGPVSPETGLNGSSKAALALPGWKAEPDKGRHCVLLQRPRGRPSMGPQTGTRPGSRPCNSRQASALRGKNFSLPSQKEICALILVCQNVNCLACVCLCVYFKKKTIKYWRRKWQPTPVFLLGKSYGPRSLAGGSPGSQKSQTRLSKTTATTYHVKEYFSYYLGYQL